MRRPSLATDQADWLAERGVAGVALLVIGLVMACRVGWLAVQSPRPYVADRSVAVTKATTEPGLELQAEAPVAEHGSGDLAAQTPTARLTHAEAAMLSAVCPTALDSLPAAVLPDGARATEREVLDIAADQPTASTVADPADAPARGRLTDIRIAARPTGPLRLAQAPTAPPEGWLVSPERWFVDEDRPPAPVAEPAEPEPDAPMDSKTPSVQKESVGPAATPAMPAETPLRPQQPEKPQRSAQVRADKPIRRQLDAVANAVKRFEEQADVDGSGWTGPRLSVPTEPTQPARPPSPISNDSTGESLKTEAPPSQVFAPPAVEPPLVQSRRPSAQLRDEGAERVTPTLRTSPAPLPQPVFSAPRPEVGVPPQPESIAPPAPTPHGGYDAKKAADEARIAAGGKSADESHRELFAKNCYPSARDCAECHERIYNEWSISSHAYAFVSPMFQRFEETITKLSNGTVGHFCYRCHSPIGTAMGELRSTPIGDLAEVAREGVTCIACHRVNQRYGKSNGDRRIVPGDRYAPVYGGVGGDGVAQVIAEKDKYKVKTSDSDKGPGVGIHNEGRFFDQLTQAEACTSCHQVAVHPGIKLEVVWEQYRASPACKKGVTCQECHMGRVPGMAGGYNYGPIAEINGKTVNNHRKQSSHLFYGPGYSIAHPGIFPQHKDAANWKFNDWLLYDWRAGWGTDEFEDRVEAAEDNGVDTSAWFPKVWAEVDDRYEAREVIDDNLERLKVKRRYREIVMENGSKVEGPFFRETPAAGDDLEFDYIVTNLNEGHNLPTASLGAQPQLWANVVLIGPDGRRLWETGYTDSNGDLCDIHSVDVRHGRIPFDKQLFNLQTMFLITGATGTDREFYLPVNFDIDPVAQLRPGAIPITVTNHPPFIRMEMRSISPLGKKRVKYTVPKELVRQRGRYRLSFRLRSRTEPMFFMRLCESTPEMIRAMIEGTLDIHPYSVEFEVR